MPCPTTATDTRSSTGELLVTPAPSWLHQRRGFHLARLLAPRRSAGLECLIAPEEVAFSQRRSVEPDVFVVPLVHARPATCFEDVQRLVLAVEVISPSTARADRYRKRHLYQSEEVPEYWIVDPDARFVERWRPGTTRRRFWSSRSRGRPRRGASRW
ncbi:MAG: Uma2 family endonuclease [Gemmatimonadetes bacterium]|nr:Uma2 family endonuclease [Gemmatimonadota bacterium]